MRARHSPTLLLSLVLIGAVLWPPAGAAETEERRAPAIRFTRIYFDSPGSDTGKNWSLNAEWARVTNFSKTNRKLGGWTIRDKGGRHVYKFPNGFVLRAGKSVRLHTGRGTNTRTDVYWRQDWYVWNNTGDVATLKNKLGTRIDRCTFGGAGSATNC